MLTLQLCFDVSGFGFGKLVNTVQTSHISENKDDSTDQEKEKNLEMKKANSESDKVETSGSEPDQVVPSQTDKEDGT